MRLPDLIVAARRVCPDSGIDDAEWITYANEALAAASGTVFLPDLEASAVVELPAGATSVPLPGNFQRELFSVRNGQGQPLAILKSTLEIGHARRAGTSAGVVRAVAAIGRSRLEVWPAPEEAETLFLGYYRLPNTLEQTAGTVTFSATPPVLTAVEPVFARFHYGDTFIVSGSAANDGEHVVETATPMTCSIVGTIIDEAAVSVSVAALHVEAVPGELHRAVLVNGMLARAYDTKEDAVEGKPNTDRHMALTVEAFRELKRAINATGYRASVSGPSEIRFRGLV